MTSNYRRPRPRPAAEVPVIPSLSPESVAGLDPAAVSARVVAAEERRTRAERGAAAHRLAERVATLAPPVAREPAPPAPQAPPATNGPQRAAPGPDAPGTGRPWREGPLTVPTRRPDPAPPTFTEDELATLARMLGAERQREREGGSLRLSATAPGPRPTTRTPRPRRRTQR